MDSPLESSTVLPLRVLPRVGETVAANFANNLPSLLSILFTVLSKGIHLGSLWAGPHTITSVWFPLLSHSALSRFVSSNCVMISQSFLVFHDFYIFEEYWSRVL